MILYERLHGKYFPRTKLYLVVTNLRIVSTAKIVVSFQFHFWKENFSLSVFLKKSVQTRCKSVLRKRPSKYPNSETDTTNDMTKYLKVYITIWFYASKILLTIVNAQKISKTKFTNCWIPFRSLSRWLESCLIFLIYIKFVI